MSSSLLLQQCPACLVRRTCIVFVMRGKCKYSFLISKKLLKFPTVIAVFFCIKYKKKVEQKTKIFQKEVLYLWAKHVRHCLLQPNTDFNCSSLFSAISLKLAKTLQLYKWPVTKQIDLVCSAKYSTSFNWFVCFLGGFFVFCEGYFEEVFEWTILLIGKCDITITFQVFSFKN